MGRKLGPMGFDQDLEIQSTPKTNLFVCTTGISEEEKRLIRSQLPRHVVLEDALTTKTNYLVTYRATMTDKYVQALKWGIRILNVRWLYDADGNTKRHEMLPFEGASFATSGTSNDAFMNYYCLLGATFKKNLGISTDFLVSDCDEGEKSAFCAKYGIPVVVSGDVFRGSYEVYRREPQFDAMEIVEKAMFSDKVFFLDPELPKGLFNSLRRMIIENGGTRVSVVDSNVEFVLTLCYERFEQHGAKIHYYQYVFDCVETNAVLFPGPYKMYPRESRCILNNAVCCIDSGLGEGSVEVLSKLRALGALVKTSPDAGCTHLIIRDKREYRKSRQTPYKIVLSEWVDQCLYTLRHVKEDKYLLRKESISLFERKMEDVPVKKVRCILPRTVLFQFTGLPLFLRNKVIARLEELNVGYSNADRYEGCTHLVMGTVSTSEKFLSCLCSGGWILRPDFVDDFDNSPCFDFSRYEWTVDENTLEKDRKIVSAVRRWRERVEITGRQAFHKWIVRLCCDEQRRESYARVIESGGGRVTADDSYTHCFVSKSYDGDVPEGKKYSTDYIFSHLFQ